MDAYKIYWSYKDFECVCVCVCVFIFVKEVFPKELKLDVQEWITKDQSYYFICCFLETVPTAIYVFSLLTLIGAKDYYSHFKGEKPEIRRLNIQPANKWYGQKSNPGQSDSKFCKIMGMRDTRAWSFPLIFFLSSLFFLGEMEINAQGLG